MVANKYIDPAAQKAYIDSVSECLIVWMFLEVFYNLEDTYFWFSYQHLTTEYIGE